MKLRAVAILALLALWLGDPPAVSAHRVDEYLQATRISMDRDRVRVEISLTAGIEVAPLVFSWMDANHDGQLSRSEAEAYAQEVLRSMELVVDGRPVPLALAGHQFPKFREMSLGTGTIRLQANAKLRAVADGNHRVIYRNTHRPEWSVYLANALVPDDDRVEIFDQHRDSAQRELAIDYRVLPAGPRPTSAWLIAVVALTGGAGVSISAALVRRGRRNRSARPIAEHLRAS